MTRLDKIRQTMNQKGVDGLLVTSAPNRFYVSKFSSSAGVALITQDKAYYIVDFRYIEAATKKVDKEFTVLQLNETFIKDVSKMSEELGIINLGFENMAMSVKEFENYKAALSCNMVSFDDGIEIIRQVKSPEELEYIKTAQAIAEKAYAALLPQLKAGMTEKEVATILMYEMYKNGANGLSFPVISVSGANSSLPHGVPTDKKIENGDFLTMDFGVIFNGYCSDMTRTIAFGYVTEEMEKVYNTVLKAQLNCLENAKVGMSGVEIDALARDIITEAGYGDCFQHGLGHCVGINVHESPRANKVDKSPLSVGNILTVEPGIYLAEKFGVRIEDMLYFGENGTENLTKAPKDLYIVK